MTQCDTILAYMDFYGSITQMQALKECHCLRLASRIHDLRKMGHDIRKEMIPVETKSGSIAYVARYSLGVQNG